MLVLDEIPASYTKFVFFGPIGKTRCPLWPLIGWDIFDFSSETAERNSTKLDRMQDLNVLYKVCVFRVDRKNKMAALRLIGWDIFDFSSENAEYNSSKLAGSKISTSATNFFFGSIWKTKRPPWPLIGWDIFHFSFETAEGNSTKLDRCVCVLVFYVKCNDISFIYVTAQMCRRTEEDFDRMQDLNVLYHVCVLFGLIGKRNDPGPPIGWDIFAFFSVTAKRNSSNDLNASTKFVFGPIGKLDCRPGLWMAEPFLTSPLKLLNRIQGNLTERKISMSSSKFGFVFGPIGMAVMVSDLLKKSNLKRKYLLYSGER